VIPIASTHIVRRFEFAEAAAMEKFVDGVSDTLKLRY
jgi:hypothetical protein